ncbi:hypothetical protein [Deinococcus sp.]|uniref:hypothetical protein n=1 Tax=Deinococcus sp. TaxID=47478 RepID=UPI003C7B4C96
MTQHQQNDRVPQHSRPSLAARPLQSATVFGTVFFEVVLRPGAASVPTLPGWTLRLWPQARLGDATLEATPGHGQGADELLQSLKALGVQPLGPMRHRRI